LYKNAGKARLAVYNATFESAKRFDFNILPLEAQNEKAQTPKTQREEKEA